MEPKGESPLQNLPQAQPSPHRFNSHSLVVPQEPATAPAIECKCKEVQYEVKMQNVVATVSVACQLNLQNVYSRTRYSEYNPERFNGVVMRLLEPRCTVLVLGTGQIICTGTRSEADARLGCRKFARILQLLGYPVKFVDFKLQNMVATVDLRFPIRLESLNQKHGQFTSYNTEIFPALIYRMWHVSTCPNRESFEVFKTTDVPQPSKSSKQAGPKENSLEKEVPKEKASELEAPECKASEKHTSVADDAEENWDLLPDKPSYDPHKYAENAKVLRLPVGLKRSERKAFRAAERERLSKDTQKP